ncbi:MAG: glycosyltransferase [Kiloniellales bacterium]
MPKNSPDVEILLATYQSELFLEELLKSLSIQTHQDFLLTVADDHSTDETIEIVRRCEALFRHPINLIRRPQPTGSAKANFAQLLTESRGKYLFLADHDDIWNADKVQNGLARLRALEDSLGSDTPIITHSDLQVVDALAQPVAPSFWSFKAQNPQRGCDVRTAVFHATVTGCAMAMNRATVLKSGPIPSQAVMHDWWLNLVAATFGKVDFDPQPNLKYRVHGGNVSRPQRVSPWSFFNRRYSLQVVRSKVDKRINQATAFAERFDLEAPPHLREFFADMKRFRDCNAIERRRMMVRHNMWMPGIWRNAGLFLAV